MAICDGCNVLNGFEHRCHGDHAMVYGVQTGQKCTCAECKLFDLENDLVKLKEVLRNIIDSYRYLETRDMLSITIFHGQLARSINSADSLLQDQTKLPNT